MTAWSIWRAQLMKVSCGRPANSLETPAVACGVRTHSPNVHHEGRGAMQPIDVVIG